MASLSVFCLLTIFTAFSFGQVPYGYVSYPVLEALRNHGGLSSWGLKNYADVYKNMLPQWWSSYQSPYSGMVAYPAMSAPAKSYAVDSDVVYPYAQPLALRNKP